MKKFRQTFLAAVVLAGLTMIPQYCPAAIPSGAVTFTNTDEANSLWDATRITDLNNLKLGIADIGGTISFPVAFTQDGGGKLVGAGTTTITFDTTDFSGTIPSAAYKISGTLKSKGGVATLKFSATATGTASLQGANRRVSASQKLTATLDANSHSLTGTYMNKASASGLGSPKPDTGPLPQTWASVAPQLGNGGWVLSMALANDGSKKIAGTATVTLNSGASFTFVAKGVYSAKTDTSKLVLSPTAGSKGSALKILMSGNSIAAIQGKVSGQSVMLVP
jgi:hypothetical protein